MTETIITREKLENLITGPRAMEAIGRALVGLYNRQTADEQELETTSHDNGVGFTGVDGKIGASMAKFYIRTGVLSQKQIAFWQKRDRRGITRLGKYHRQLNEIAVEKQGSRVN